MSTVLGLFGLVLFIAAVITFAMGITWTVVKISPDPAAKTKSTDALA